MAINVNSVYQTVLLILNKEQRGYITPQEFNNIANQVQLEIFNSYFPDGDQANRKNQTNQQNNTEFYNSFDNQDSRLDPFKFTTTEFVYDSVQNAWYYPSNVLQISKIGAVYCNYNNNQLNKEADRLSFKEFKTTSASKLTAPTNNYPIFYVTYTEESFEAQYSLVNWGAPSFLQFISGTDIIVGDGIYNKTQDQNYGVVNTITTLGPPNLQLAVDIDLTSYAPNTPNPGDEILVTRPDAITLFPHLHIAPQPASLEVSGVQLPSTVKWGYAVQGNGSYLYQASESVDFDLVPDERSKVILEILKYCGVLIRDPQIVQQASQTEAVIEANEKR
jgi:hypothetical protein